jgi:hypothetical protein
MNVTDRPKPVRNRARLVFVVAVCCLLLTVLFGLSGKAGSASAPGHAVAGYGGETFDGGYYTVEEVVNFMGEEAATHQGIAERVDIGDSWCKTHPGQCTFPSAWNGYDMWVMRITNLTIPGPKPVFWFDTGIHSREIATPEIAIRFIKWLLDNYDTDPDAHWLVDYHDIWVMPLVNPDGHHMVESGGNAPTYHRKNADNDDGCTTYDNWGVDLNRNYPFMWACCGGSTNDPCDMNNYRGPEPNSEEETQAIVSKIRELVPDQRGPAEDDAVPITGTGVFQSMHSHGTVNFFPWIHTLSPAPNDASLRNIAAHMSALDAGGNGYPYCNDCHSIIDGSSADWAYGELGAAAMSTEISGSSFAPPYEDIDGLWNENRGMLIYLAKIARTPYLTTRGPDANSVATSPVTVTQGTDFQVTGVINHAWEENSYSQRVAEAEYYIDNPPWAGGTPIAMTGDFTSTTVPVSAQVSTTSIAPGRHIIYVRGRGEEDYSGLHSWGPVSAAFVYVVTETATPTPLATATATAQLTATATACTVQFTDVPVDSPFHQYIRCLGCMDVVSGYPCGNVGEPCDAQNNPYFRPGSGITRGQIAKIVSNSAGLSGDPGEQRYEDVPEGGPFYLWISRLSDAGVMGGYPCGAEAEPCVPPLERPYFRPYNHATRGQLSKIASNAAGFAESHSEQTFADVGPDAPFYLWVERLAYRGLIGGYPCGGINPETGESEPCDELHRAYFRSGNLVTRGQTSKIATLTFFPDCSIPAR